MMRALRPEYTRGAQLGAPPGWRRACDGVGCAPRRPRASRSERLLELRRRLEADALGRGDPDLGAGLRVPPHPAGPALHRERPEAGHHEALVLANGARQVL